MQYNKGLKYWPSDGRTYTYTFFQISYKHPNQYSNTAVKATDKISLDKDQALISSISLLQPLDVFTLISAKAKLKRILPTQFRHYYSIFKLEIYQALLWVSLFSRHFLQFTEKSNFLLELPFLYRLKNILFS